jgi:hypothetical protein
MVGTARCGRRGDTSQRDALPANAAPTGLRQRPRVLRQIIGDLVPSRAIIHERVKLRAHARIVVKCSHANGNLIAFRPASAEQAGTAVDAKGFHCAFSFSVNTNQVFALQQAELLLPYARLGAYRRAGMFSAAFAMTMTRTDERRLNLKMHCTAEATPTDFVAHGSALLQRPLASLRRP